MNADVIRLLIGSKCRMEYNHSRKAGNRGDAWKHSVLLALADVLPATSDTFRYVESHSGAPVHELGPGGEWECGVGRFASNESCDCQYAAVARRWLALNRYPASWVMVVDRLAKRFPKVRATLSDLADSVAADYPPRGVHVPPNVDVDFRQADGYVVAASLEEADLVFLDPPFHPSADADWQKLAASCRSLAERGVPFVAWYPFFWPTRPQRFADITRCEAWEITWASCGAKPSQNLKGCGMLASPQLVPALESAAQELKRVSFCLDSAIRVRLSAAV